MQNSQQAHTEGSEVSATKISTTSMRRVRSCVPHTHKGGITESIYRKPLSD